MRELFLTIISSGNVYGYELRQTLERQLGPMAPAINAGQIYTTLGRLERDGLVTSESVPEDSRGKRVYSLTQSGWNVLNEWVSTPVPGTRLKDEFFMKLVVAGSAKLAEPLTMIAMQRREYLQSLRDLDAYQRSNSDNVSTEILVEGAILHLKADLEWLDFVEQRLP